MTFTSVTDLLSFSYTQFDAFCALIIGILLWTTLTDTDRTVRRIYLANVMVTVIMYCAVDAFWVLVYNDFFLPRTFQLRYVTNILLYTAMTLCSYTIFRFLTALLKFFDTKRALKSRHIFIPFAVIILLVVTTPWTHLLFTIQSDGSFVKGPLYFILMMAMFGYAIFFGIMALVRAFRAENEDTKLQYLLVTAYSVPVIIGALIHYSFYMLPTFALGFTVATLIIFVLQMRDQVSVDALTGINNRKMCERFLLKRISELNEAAHSTMGGLYLLMLDLNKFKAINDTYGHAEGDRALVATADALKEACACIRSRCILSRFGGDEFVIGAMLSSEEEAVILRQKIDEMLAKQNAQLDAPYKLSISVGCAKYRKDYKTLKAFLAVADQEMYEKKQASRAP